MNTFTQKDFASLSPLDEGGEAKTYKASSATFGDVCVKVFNGGGVARTNKKEIDVLLRRSSHPNLVRFLGIFEQTHGGLTPVSQGYVMEYMQGGSLDAVIHNHDVHLTYSKICGWMVQAGRGLQYLHEGGIIHRDVKPKNMLLDGHQEVLKLSDFGLAKPIEQATVTTNSGTVSYMAPEVLLGEQRPYASSIDVYALGVSFWEMLHRRHPYLTSGFALANKVIEGERPQFDGNIGPRTRELIERMWQENPDSRCSVLEIIDFATERANRPSASTSSTTRHLTPSNTTQLPPRVFQPAPKPASNPATISQVPKKQSARTTSPRQHQKIDWELRAIQGYFFSLSEALFVKSLAGLRIFLTNWLAAVRAGDNPSADDVYHCYVLGKLGPVPDIVAWQHQLDTFEKYGITEPRRNRFFVNYSTMELYFFYHERKIHKHSSKPEKFLRFLKSLETKYIREGSRVRISMADQEFDCLLVTNWLGVGQFTRDVAKGVYGSVAHCPLQFKLKKVPEGLLIGDFLDSIYSALEDIGSVRRIIFLLDPALDYGLFNEEWSTLSSDKYSSFHLIMEKSPFGDGNCEELRQSTLEDFTSRFSCQIAMNLNVDLLEVSGHKVISEREVHRMFWNAFNEIVRNLIENEPSMPLRWNPSTMA